MDSLILWYIIATLTTFIVISTWNVFGNKRFTWLGILILCIFWPVTLMLFIGVYVVMTMILFVKALGD